MLIFKEKNLLANDVQQGPLNKMTSTDKIPNLLFHQPEPLCVSELQTCLTDCFTKLLLFLRFTPQILTVPASSSLCQDEVLFNSCECSPHPVTHKC